MPFKQLFNRIPFLRNGRDHGRREPSPEPFVIPMVEEFVSLNREAIDRLATFIDFAEGFTIGFVEINFLADLNILIRQLAQHPHCQEAQFIEFDLGDPNLRFLKDELLNRLRASHLEPGKKPVLWLKGLEQSIGMSGEYPPMLADLNFVRDAYTDQVPYLVLFCLPDYAVNRVIKFAPDFWSWGSGVFRFQTRPSTQQQAADNTIFSERIRGSLQIADWQERIDQLERLAMEYRPSSDPSREELGNYCHALMELGYAYKGLGDTSRAEYQLQQALQIAESSEDLLYQQASALHFLGILCADTGKVAEAENLYSRSIELKTQIDDLPNKAATLHQLGMLKANQGEIDEAIALYQQSLDITKQIGNVQGQAATLHELGILKANQGEIEAAIALYQQSLDIEEQIDNVQGQASTLHCLGNLKANQGKIEEAIALYQQSLDITKQIGDVQTQAATQHQLGILKFRQDKIDDALQLLEESVKIKRQIGWIPGLPPTLDWLALIAEQQGDIATAETYLQEALTIAQRVGSPDAAGYQSRLARLQSPPEQA